MRRKPIKTLEELENFLNVSARCLCGRLLTGLHERNCSRIRKMREKLTVGNGKK